MKRLSPRNLDRKLAQRLLDAAESEKRADTRMDLISAKLVGRPYQANLLVGSASSPEIFTARLEAFDCVTYIETVLALARSSHVQDFVEKLYKIRYASGEIAWTRRNHYMTEWIRQNIRSGWVRR